jgi:hypothetical protein
MKTSFLIVLLFSFLSKVYAASPSAENILNINKGDKVGHYLNAPEVLCALSVFLPGQYISDTNYWIVNDWQVATEMASYPYAEAAGGYGWELNQSKSSIKFYLDSTKQNFREFNFDSTTLTFVSFTANQNGVRSNTCLLVK